MNKFKLLDGTASDDNRPKRFNWDLCALCQTVKPESLQCPNDTTRADKGAGYKSLANSLEIFNEIGELPSSVRYSDLDDGNGRNIKEELRKVA